MTFALLAIPLVLVHQGRLTDENDAPLTGEVSIKVSVHPDAFTPGNKIWDVTYNSVQVFRGVYKIDIGDKGPNNDLPEMPADLFDADNRFLEIAVNGQAMTPRLRIGVVPYALRTRIADELGDHVAADYALAADVATDIAAAKTAGLADAKAYADGKLTEAKGYADGKLVDAKAYADGKLVEAKSYADARLVDAKDYSDGNLDTGELYTDASLVTAKAYTDASLITGKAYTDASLVTAKTYTDTKTGAIQTDLQTNYTLKANPHAGFDADTVDGLHATDLQAGNTYVAYSKNTASCAAGYTAAVTGEFMYYMSTWGGGATPLGCVDLTGLSWTHTGIDSWFQTERDNGSTGTKGHFIGPMKCAVCVKTDRPGICYTAYNKGSCQSGYTAVVSGEFMTVGNSWSGGHAQLGCVDVAGISWTHTGIDGWFHTDRDNSSSGLRGGTKGPISCKICCN